MKTILTTTQKNRLTPQGRVDLNLHTDHLCSAGEEVFLTLPWTDCICRYGMMVKHSALIKGTNAGSRIRTFSQVPVTRRTA
jgi:hypothetical protein